MGKRQHNNGGTLEAVPPSRVRWPRCRARRDRRLQQAHCTHATHHQITESIVGIDLNPIDISTAVHNEVESLLNKYLTTSFIDYNGSQLTLVDYLNAKGSYYVSQVC